MLANALSSETPKPVSDLSITTERASGATAPAGVGRVQMKLPDFYHPGQQGKAAAPFPSAANDLNFYQSALRMTREKLSLRLRFTALESS